VRVSGKDEEIIPYTDGMDHLIAEMDLIRGILSHKVESMALHFESEMETAYRGFGITPSEARYQLKKAEAERQGNVVFHDRDRFDEIKRRVDKSIEECLPLPLVRLQQLFGLSRFETDILVSCLLPEFYPGLGRVLSFLQDDATLSYPSMGFLMELFCSGHEERRAAWQAFLPGSPLRAWNLIVPAGEEIHRPPMKKTYRVDDRIVTYLMGSSHYDGSLEGSVVMVSVDPVESLAEHQHPSVLDGVVADINSGKECYLLSLTGEDSDASHIFVRAMAAKLRWKVLRIHLAALYRQQEWHMSLLGTLLREAVLQPAVVLLHEEKDANAERLPEMAAFLSMLARKGIVICYQGQRTLASDVIYDMPIHFIKLTFDHSETSERLSDWLAAIRVRGLDWSDQVVEQLVMRYPISKRRVEAILDRLPLHFEGEGLLSDRALSLFQKVANDYTRQPLDELAQRIESVFGWDDLILQKSTQEHLQAFRNTVVHQYKVYETWGLGAKTPRGRGVVALFSGPSGTGKTMAAEVIARDLGINLYRVDLAGLVSKYIGETEKNIRKIFDTAKTNVLLFFDEADALFGRRTEMNDAHDRYANLEVNYLLQRLEDHEGPVILATNMRKNMDEAFIRRIHFIIEFPSPTEPFRHLLLQKYLPSSVPRSDDVDTGVLAKHFELTGGDIKNAAVQAAFIAAEDGGAVTMDHLLTSMRREYLKLGKVFPSAQVSHFSKTIFDSPDDRRRKKGTGTLWTSS
jgi:winged helix domain-containing protein/ATPase family protein associated with various cellular activities (AAA)